MAKAKGGEEIPGLLEQESGQVEGFCGVVHLIYQLTNRKTKSRGIPGHQSNILKSNYQVERGALVWSRKKNKVNLAQKFFGYIFLP